MKITRIFQESYPLKISWETILLPNIAAGALVFFLAPFGFMVSSWPLRLGFALAFILLGVLAVLSVLGFWKYWGKLNSDTWTFGRDCLLMLQVVGVIALLNTGFVYLLVSHSWTLLEVFWKIGLGTFIISIIPAALMLIYDRYQLQKSQLKASLAKQTDLANQVAQQAVPIEQICFTTEQGKPVLQLLATEILFIKSDGNYVEIFHQSTGEALQRTLLRNRLKTIWAQLPESIFFPAHKRYIINQQQIVQVQGNARRLEVFLRGYETPIPVSRSKIKDLQNLLAAQ